jgi:DNA-binding IclR family transcriptional regulator
LGRVETAISVSGIRAQVLEGEADRMIDLVVRASKEISALMGAPKNLKLD